MSSPPRFLDISHSQTSSRLTRMSRTHLRTSPFVTVSTRKVTADKINPRRPLPSLPQASLPLLQPRTDLECHSGPPRGTVTLSIKVTGRKSRYKRQSCTCVVSKSSSRNRSSRQESGGEGSEKRAVARTRGRKESTGCYRARWISSSA